MKVSHKCIYLIRRFEGFSAKPYLCPANVPTIGYGSTRYENGDAVSMDDAAIDEARAIGIMRAALKSYENDVLRYLKVPVNQNQFDALVDFAYNCGSKNLLKSTLLAKVNEQKFDAAAKEFDKWIYANGRKLSGLINRRKAERALFESSVGLIL